MPKDSRQAGATKDEKVMRLAEAIYNGFREAASAGDLVIGDLDTRSTIIDGEFDVIGVAEKICAQNQLV